MRRSGGRPLGPNTYSPAPLRWLVEPERQTSAFASKTRKGQLAAPLTADIDFYSQQTTELTRGDAPGTRGFTWSKRPITDAPGTRAPPLDVCYDVDTGTKQTLVSSVARSSLKYASTFQSNAKRFVPRDEATALGPGAYASPPSAVQIRDAKRASSAFKSLTVAKGSYVEQNAPPDNIQSSTYADQAKKWTSKGLAFSTRERFPRSRPKWKD